MFKNAGIIGLIILLLAGCAGVAADRSEVPAPIEEEPSEEAVAQPQPQKFRLIAVGDMMLTRGVGARIRRSSVHAPFDGVRHILETGDIVFGNLETTIATSGTQLPGKGIWFRAAPEVTEGLKEAGFDVLSLANNHTLDYDTPALIETVQNLQQAGIGYVGAGENLEQARRPLVVVKNGVRVGFLAYNEFYNYFWSYSYRRTFEATEDMAGTAPMKEELIREDVEKLKDLCDVVVVSLHWGIENSNRITPAQQQLGHKIIDWGADIVLGHHPHVLQGIEFYNDKLIVYSLGNFIFDQNGDNNNQSIILDIELKDGEIIEVAVYPIQIHDKHQPRIPDDSKKETILNRIEKLSEALGTSAQREEQGTVLRGI
ncbi:MAG: CapA family protein [Bacillota bacterium]|nr:CapA family protein [Bacillota bacterium]MDD3297993.1 CapA family protein [Bacillota bacterium]MDD3850024.1 CapA family protein [Bacillota bacterium]MDD4706739.1 CapA family protein [Bacillota bacterium]